MKQQGEQRPGTRRSPGGHFPDCIPGVVCHCPIEPIGPVVARPARPVRVTPDHDPGDEDRS